MKQLKPGQLCTIYGNRFSFGKAVLYDSCNKFSNASIGPDAADTVLKWWDPLKRTVENHTKHVYRCKKAQIDHRGIYGVCEECKRINKNKGCLLSYNSVSPAEETCFRLFGSLNYPVLVK